MNNRPRVLLTNFHPRFSGGHASSITRICTSWLADYFNFAVAAPKRSDVYERCAEAGVQIYACDFPRKFAEFRQITSSMRLFRQIIYKFDPSLIHCNGGADLNIAAWSFPFSRRVKFIRHHRAIKGLKSDWYHRWLYGNRVDANIYTSVGAMKLSHQQGMVPTSGSYVIYNGVDTQYFQPHRCTPSDRYILCIRPDEFVFGSCAGVDKYKRVDLILQAARELRNRFAFKIVLLGDENPIPNLMKLAERLGVQDRIIYGGNQKDVRPFVACFDVGFVLSDSIETLSNAAREMMSMGKPLLSSSFSGLPENITNGIEGILVPPGDLSAVVSAMEVFLKMPPEQLRIMSAAALERAKAQFDLEKTLVPLKDLYQRFAEC